MFTPSGLDGPQKDQVGWQPNLNPKSGSPASILGSPAIYPKKAKRFFFPLFMLVINGSYAVCKISQKRVLHFYDNSKEILKKSKHPIPLFYFSHELGLLERLSVEAVTDIIHQRIKHHVQNTCGGNFETSYLGTLENVSTGNPCKSKL